MNEIKNLATRVFRGLELSKFNKFIDGNNTEKAMALVNEAMDEARESVLEAVVKDECDFVLMSHYKHTYFLYTEMQEQGL